MFSAEDYLQGWIVYSIGASCLLLFLWLVLRASMKGLWSLVQTVVFSVALRQLLPSLYFRSYFIC